MHPAFNYILRILRVSFSSHLKICCNVRAHPFHYFSCLWVSNDHITQSSPVFGTCIPLHTLSKLVVVVAIIDFNPPIQSHLVSVVCSCLSLPDRPEDIHKLHTCQHLLPPANKVPLIIYTHQLYVEVFSSPQMLAFCESESHKVFGWWVA